MAEPMNRSLLQFPFRKLTRHSSRLPVRALIAFLVLSGALPQVSAQTFTTYYNFDYGTTWNPRQSLDLILPNAPASSTMPVIVFIHGGAWQSGDKLFEHGRLRSLIGNTYIGIVINHRFSSEAIWPAQIHDCKAAIRWIRGNTSLAGIPFLPAAYGPGGTTINPQKIGVWGHSSGGHLASMLGVSGDVAELEGAIGIFLGEASTVSCVADYFGPSDLPSMGVYPSIIDHDSPFSPESLLIGGAVQQNLAAARSASTTTYVTSDDPPFFLVKGDKDLVVPYQQSVFFHNVLNAHSVDTRFIKMVGGGHGGFQHVELPAILRSFFDLHLRDVPFLVKDGPLPNGVDLDDDVMLDSWEIAHGLDPADPTDALMDDDADGMTNREEYLAETDPANAFSLLQITDAQASGNSAQFVFDTVDDRIYRILGSADLDAWFTLESAVLGPDGGGPATVVATGIHGETEPCRFFRVAVE